MQIAIKTITSLTVLSVNTSPKLSIQPKLHSTGGEATEKERELHAKKQGIIQPSKPPN